MTDRVLVCTAYDESTGTCSVQAWVEQPQWPPPLSVADAIAIAQAFLLAYAAVMAVKLVARKAQ